MSHERGITEDVGCCDDCGTTHAVDALIQCPRCNVRVCAGCYCQAESMCGRCDEELHGLSLDDWNGADDEFQPEEGSEGRA